MTAPQTQLTRVSRGLFLFSKTDRIDAQAIRDDDGDRELKKSVVPFLDTGHFVPEGDEQVIADHFRRFLSTNVKRGSLGRG